ncbi:hypothetical protein GCM10027435_24810 [Haloparvum alkalitolerans]
MAAVGALIVFDEQPANADTPVTPVAARNSRRDSPVPGAPKGVVMVHSTHWAVATNEDCRIPVFEKASEYVRQQSDGLHKQTKGLLSKELRSETHR